MNYLIIGTSRQGHDQLLKEGHNVVVFIDRKAALTSDLAKNYSQIYYYSDQTDVSHLIEIAQSLHRAEPFDRVYSFHDTTQELARCLSEAIDIDFPISQKLIALAHNKYEMRRHLESCGLDNVKSGVVESLAAATSVATEFGFPVIIKPTEGTGSSGVSKVNNAGEIDAAVAWLKQCGNDFPILIEQFVSGREFSVESFSENNQHRVLSITEKFIDSSSFVEKGHLMPARITSEEWQSITDYVVKVLSAIELQDGPSHTEIILSATDGTPCLIETHTRPGGDRITDLLTHVTGYDVFELTCQQLMGKSVLADIPDPIVAKAHCAIWFSTVEFSEPVSLGNSLNFDEVEQWPGITELKILKPKGSKLAKVTNSFDRVSMAVAVADSSDGALDLAKKAVSALKFEINFDQ